MLAAGDVPVALNHFPRGGGSPFLCLSALVFAWGLTPFCCLELLRMGWQDFCAVKDGAPGNGPTPQGLPDFQAQLPECGVCWI